MWDVAEVVAKVVLGPLGSMAVRAVRAFGKDIKRGQGREFAAKAADTYHSVKEKAKDFFGGLFGRKRANLWVVETTIHRTLDLRETLFSVPRVLARVF